MVITGSRESGGLSRYEQWLGSEIARATVSTLDIAILNVIATPRDCRGSIPQMMLLRIVT